MGFSSVYEREQFIIDSESQNTHHPDRQSLFLTEEHLFYMCFIYICNTCSPIWKSLSVASAYVKSTLCGPHCSCPQHSEAFQNYAYIVMRFKKKFTKSFLIALIQEQEHLQQLMLELAEGFSAIIKQKTIIFT